MTLIIEQPVCPVMNNHFYNNYYIHLNITFNLTDICVKYNLLVFEKGVCKTMMCKNTEKKDINTRIPHDFCSVISLFQYLGVSKDN